MAFGGVLAAACSSGSSPPSTTGAPSSTTSTATGSAPTTARPVTTTSGSTSTTGSVGTRCPTSDLAASIAGSSGAAGTIEVTVALRSSASTACVLGGYPGLLLIGTGGTALPTTVVRGGAYSFTSQPVTTVHLSSGQSAEFNIGYSDVVVGTETTCPTSTALEVTPPGASDHLTVTAALAPCGHGTLVVSPVFAATRSTAPAG